MAGIITDLNKLGGVPQSASRHVAMSTCFDIFLDSTLIGFISSLTLGHNRTVTQIRHINSVDAGIAVDTTVTPDAVTLQYAGFYVYAAGTSAQATELAGALAGNNAKVGPSGGRLSGVGLLMTLDQQGIPFDIVVRHSFNNGIPLTDNNASGTVVGVYKNCTLASMSVPIQLTAAAVSDSGSISVGYVASAHS